MWRSAASQVSLSLEEKIVTGKSYTHAGSRVTGSLLLSTKTVVLLKIATIGSARRDVCQPASSSIDAMMRFSI
jgi:hypothetical protein